MVKADHASALALVDEVCATLLGCSDDPDHPAVKYGQLIASLANKLGQPATSVRSVM